jgi:hypothetical protein
MAISRFSVADTAIQDAIELAGGAEPAPDRVTAPGDACPVQLAGWERLVEYRNRAEAHPATYSWPVSHPDYYAIMSPLLEDALVEALTAAHVERVSATIPWPRWHISAAGQTGTCMRSPARISGCRSRR